MLFCNLDFLTKKETLELIKQNHQIEIDIDKIPLDDEKTFSIFQNANCVGIFQFEAPHLVNILKEMKPTSFEDLIALNALNRPGPSQYIPKYIKRTKQIRCCKKCKL